MKNLFVKPDNPILTKVAQNIPKSKFNSAETRKIVETMLKVAHGQRKNRKRPIMVGLAAPQIGILKRIILVDVKSDGKGPLRPRPASPNRGESEARKVGDLRIYINPQITRVSKEKGEWYEGCYSTGNVCGIVRRPVSIMVSGYVLKTPGVRSLLPPRWDIVEEKYSGYVARIFQHEVDHLNGKRFPDLIKDPDKLHWVLKKEFPLYRNKQAWKNWPKKWKNPLVQLVNNNCTLLKKA